MDALSSLLNLMRPRGHVFFTGQYCGDFSIDTSGKGFASFHVIRSGECLLEIDGKPQPDSLSAGDLVLFPRDCKHALISPEQGVDGGEPAIGLICGYFEFESPRIQPILDAMPEAVVARAHGNQSERIAVLLNSMKQEAEQPSPGSDLALDLMSEVLFLLILRSLIEESGQDFRLLAAFADPAVSRALNAIHEAPEKNWTVETLADVAALSRTAFSKKFGDLVGMPPSKYLQRFRIDFAISALRQGQLSMAQIAERCGYSSEAAFSKAFKKETGETPGSLRPGSAG